MKGHRPRPALKNKARPQSGSEDEDEDEQLSVSSNSEEILAAQRDGGRKRSVDDDLANKNFASVFADILGAEVAKPDPILSRNPGFEADIKKRKIDRAVEMRVMESRRALREQWHVKPDVAAGAEKERALRRLGTMGVVKLFNAINQQHRKFAPVTARPDLEKPGFRAVSEASFLDLLASGSTAKKAGVEHFSRARVGAPVAKAPWLDDLYAEGNDQGNDDDLGDVRAKLEEEERVQNESSG